MSTIVLLHAHPDDESSSTAGTMARAAAKGDRIVLVVATGGECGEPAADLAPGETVADRRHRELEASAATLGVARVVWLGYTDSGMTGWSQNSTPGAFMNADLDRAGRKLADVLDEEDADALVGYDWHGNYGHPDHVMVHHVTWSGVEQAARRPRVLEVSINRDHQEKVARMARLRGPEDGIKMPDPTMLGDDGNPIGSPASDLRWGVDVRDLVDVKRAAMRCHASQVTDIEGFTSLPPELYSATFGWEFFREPGVVGSLDVDWPFEGGPWPGTSSHCTCDIEGRGWPVRGRRSRGPVDRGLVD